ncbi:MAG: hypothetical protein AAFU85_20295 [Planctomycetota bacterium]
MTEEAPETTDAPPTSTPTPSSGGTSILRLVAIGVGLTVVAAGYVGYTFWETVSDNSSREPSIVPALPDGEGGMGAISVPTGQQANMDSGYSGPPPGAEDGGGESASPAGSDGRPEMDAELSPDAGGE